MIELSTYKKLLVVGAVIGVCAVCVWGWQRYQGRAENAQHVLLAAAATVTAEQAIHTALQQVAGTVIEAELEQYDGKAVWEVEIVDATHNIITVRLDAITP